MRAAPRPPISRQSNRSGGAQAPPLSFWKKECAMSNTSRRTAHSPDGALRIWQTRTDLAKQETAAANKAADAKTARLKALRLEKEAQDAEAARLAGENSPAAKRGKRG